MSLPSQCKLISKAGRLGSYNYTFECVKKGQRRRWTLSARNDSDAHAQMATIYDDDNDMGQPAPKPPTGGGGGGCLLPTELVLLEDHSMKPVGDIAPGDKLLMCKFGDSKLHAVEPDEIVFHYTDTLVTIKSAAVDLTCSSTQPIITPYGPVRAGFLFPDAVATGLSSSFELQGARYTSLSTTRNATRGETLVASVGTKEDLFFFAGKSLIGVACHIPPDIKR